MFKKFAKRALPGLLAMGLALYLAPRVIDLAHYSDKQTAAYNYALDLMAKGDSKAAEAGPEALIDSVKLFKEGLKQSNSQRFLLPPPDQELAALSFFHLGNVLRQLKKPDKALAAYLESLRLNSGQTLLLGVSARDDNMHQYGRDFCVAPFDKLGMNEPVSGDACQLRRLEKEADDTRSNIMSLLNEHRELRGMLDNPEGDKQGEGEGKAKGESGKKSELPGASPGPSAGHDDNKSI